MKLCPQCNQKCFNSAANCECGYSFRNELPGDALPDAGLKAGIKAVAWCDSEQGLFREYSTTPEGLVKLDRETPMEGFFSSAGAMTALLFLGVVWRGLFPRGHGYHYAPDPNVLRYAAIPLVAAC
jgi:hypothetical protein